jgi:hypothetical protein
MFCKPLNPFHKQIKAILNMYISFSTFSLIKELNKNKKCIQVPCTLTFDKQFCPYFSLMGGVAKKYIG